MKIKCKTSKVASLSKEILENYSIDTSDFFLCEGKEYLVYSISIYLNHVWYCICDESYTYYPIWNPGTLFEIIDDHLSRYWIFGLRKTHNNNILTNEIKDVPFISFPEWVSNIYFYEELINGSSGDSNAKIFRKYKDLMDLEFPDSLISNIAQIGDDTWLICPQCIDAFEWKSDRDALVKCPKCNTILNNPRFNISTNFPNKSGS